MKKLASGLRFWESKAEEEARKRRERLSAVSKLHDKRWGKGPHDAPLPDDTSILLPKGRYDPRDPKKPEDRTTFSTKTQIAPDSWINWIRDSPIEYPIVTAGQGPEREDAVSLLSDPYEYVYDYLNTAPRLPANWKEYSRTISDNIAAKLTPDKFFVPITNALHYAAQPILTGKSNPRKNSQEMKDLAREFSDRLAYGIRNNIGTPEGEGYAKK